MFFPNNVIIRRMSDNFNRNCNNKNNLYTSYNFGTLIPSGNKGPPPPIMTHMEKIFQEKKNSSEKDIVTNNPYPEALNGQRPMLIANPTYDQHIIKPPKANFTHGRIPDIEIICSEDRNYTENPYPSEYVIKLKDIYKNVTSVTLFNASIPNTAYLVGENNNLIYFQESLHETIIAEIPVGDYNISDLVNNISIALNDKGESKYTVSLNNLTNKFTITSDLTGGDNLFSLIFLGCYEKHDYKTRAVYPPRSIGRVLGYSRNNFLYADGKASLTTGSTTITGNSKSRFKTDFAISPSPTPPPIFYVSECDQIFTVVSIISDDEMIVSAPPTSSYSFVYLAKGSHTAPNKFNLSSDSFIILDILELENVRSNSSPIDRAFAVIPMVFPHNSKNFVISQIGGVPLYKKHFNPPLARLDRLTIRFRDIDGNLVNFNGIENFMEFRINTMNANGMYDFETLE